MHMGSDR